MLNEYRIGDSKELLKQVDSNSVDLIYIDPPYCTGRDFYHFNDRFESSSDYRELLIRPLLTECHRILSDVGNIVDSANTTRTVGNIFYQHGIVVYDLAKIISANLNFVILLLLLGPIGIRTRLKVGF